MAEGLNRGTTGASPLADARAALLGDEVRRRRKALKLRQAELADLAGCSGRFVHTLEHGKTSVRLDKILDVLAVLGLDLLVAPGHGRMGVTANSAPESKRAP